MGNKEKTIIPNRLLEIREDLKYSQKEMGEILGVSDRMICYYETDQNNLPIDKAILLSKLFNYDLKWIYRQETINTDFTNQFSSHENPNFLVDIRDVFKRNENSICFSIPDYFWEYIKKVNEINTSSLLEDEKHRAILELNGQHQPNSQNNLFWNYTIDIKEFISKLYFGDTSYTKAFFFKSSQVEKVVK